MLHLYICKMFLISCLSIFMFIISRVKLWASAFGGEMKSISAKYSGSQLLQKVSSFIVCRRLQVSNWKNTRWNLKTLKMLFKCPDDWTWAGFCGQFDSCKILQKYWVAERRNFLLKRSSAVLEIRVFYFVKIVYTMPMCKYTQGHWNYDETVVKVTVYIKA